MKERQKSEDFFYSRLRSHGSEWQYQLSNAGYFEIRPSTHRWNISVRVGGVEIYEWHRASEFLRCTGLFGWSCRHDERWARGDFLSVQRPKIRIRMCAPQNIEKLANLCSEERVSFFGKRCIRSNLRTKVCDDRHRGLHFVATKHAVTCQDLLTVKMLGNEDPLLGELNLPSEESGDGSKTLYVEIWRWNLTLYWPWSLQALPRDIFLRT